MVRFSRWLGSSVCVCALALSTGAPTLGAQTPGIGQDLDYAGVTGALRLMAAAHPTRATLSSLTKTDAGRDVWLLTVANKQGADVNTRPALLIVANLEANHRIGTTTAMAIAEQLLTGYSANAEIKQLLDEHTIYIVPRANPDGAELASTMKG